MNSVLLFIVRRKNDRFRISPSDTFYKKSYVICTRCFRSKITVLKDLRVLGGKEEKGEGTVVRKGVTFKE